MAWITADTVFDPDKLALTVVGIAAKLTQHDSGEHQHQMGQLLFTEHGCIKITLSGRLCMLPPTKIAWIPANTKHRAEMKNVVGYRSIYIDTSIITSLPDDIRVFEANVLLSAALERIAMADFNTHWQQGAAFHLLMVALDEIHQAQTEELILKLPTDRRLTKLAIDSLPLPLNQFASTVGASEKTISRIFIKETGLSYQQWRQQWRFLKAVELLSTQHNISSVASTLGFVSDSAFIYFFKTISGLAPRNYITKTKID